VISSRVHTPRRFGTTSKSRPSGRNTRQISRSSGPVRSAASRQCTASRRSIEASLSGSMASSTSTPWTVSPAVRTTAPCVAGIKAPIAFASPRNMPM